MLRDLTLFTFFLFCAAFIAFRGNFYTESFATISTLILSDRAGIFKDLAVSYLSSFLFYLIVVRMPDYQRKRQLKQMLRLKYYEFREDCTAVMLAVADGTFVWGKQRDLRDIRSFRNYFDEDVGDDQTRLDAFQNKLDEYHLNLLKVLYA